MGLDWVLRNRAKKSDSLSDSRPPVRPPGEPARAGAFETKHEGYQPI
jgi:hypothetical protein